MYLSIMGVTWFGKTYDLKFFHTKESSYHIWVDSLLFEYGPNLEECIQKKSTVSMRDYYLYLS